MRYRLCAAAAVALGALFAVSGCSPATPPDPSAATSTTAAAAGGGTAEAAPADAGVGAAAKTVAQWESGGGLTWIETFTDLNTMYNSVPASKANLSTMCGLIEQDVSGARAYGPIPDPQAETEWSTALNAFSTALTACRSAVGGSASATAQWTTAYSTAYSDIGMAAATISSLVTG